MQIPIEQKKNQKQNHFEMPDMKTCIDAELTRWLLFKYNTADTFNEQFCKQFETKMINAIVTTLYKHVFDQLSLNSLRLQEGKITLVGLLMFASANH